MGKLATRFSPTVNGVKSTITSRSSMYPCSNSQGNDGTFVWVSVEPQTTSDPNAIAQIGVATCDDYVFQACGGLTPHIFWAAGGCNYPVTAVDLGPISFSSATAAVDVGSVYVQFYYNGSLRHSEPKTAGTLNCWINGSLKGDYACERKDRGDSCGDLAAQITLTNQQIRLKNQSTWVNLSDSSAYNYNTWRDQVYTHGNYYSDCWTTTGTMPAPASSDGVYYPPSIHLP